MASDLTPEAEAHIARAPGVEKVRLPFREEEESALLGRR
jgi:hypothetical protein